MKGFSEAMEEIVELRKRFPASEMDVHERLWRIEKCFVEGRQDYLHLQEEKAIIGMKQRQMFRTEAALIKEREEDMRDRFAIAIAQAIIGTMTDASEHDVKTVQDLMHLPETCYSFAEAFIDERRKRLEGRNGQT